MIKLKSLLPLNEFKSFNDKSRNMDTIRIKNKREHQRIMKTLDKWKTRYRVPDPAKGAYHIQFYNTKEAMMHRRRLEKAGFKIIDPNNEGKLTEGVKLGDVREELEYAYEWDYVEQEGADSVRFDWGRGRKSMWVHKNGKSSGEIPKDNYLKKAMKKLGIK